MFTNLRVDFSRRDFHLELSGGGAGDGDLNAAGRVALPLLLLAALAQGSAGGGPVGPL